MQYINSTQLRTHAAALIGALSLGQTPTLIHRSKILGKLALHKETPLVFDAKQFEKKLSRLPRVETSYLEAEKNYKKHLLKTSGSHIS